jgi:hypothetical protein
MRTQILAAAWALSCIPVRGGGRLNSPPRPTVAAAPPASLTPQDSALHALNRLAYGPRPGEVARVAAAGVMRWIDRQLAPDRIDDGALARRERAFSLLTYDRRDLAAL